MVQILEGKLLDSKGRVWYSFPIYENVFVDDELDVDFQVHHYEWRQLDLPEEPVNE